MRWRRRSVPFDWLYPRRTSSSGSGAAPPISSRSRTESGCTPDSERLYFTRFSQVDCQRSRWKGTKVSAIWCQRSEVRGQGSGRQSQEIARVLEPIVWLQVLKVATAERPPQHRRRFDARRAAALHVMPGITNEDGLFRGYRESR